MQSLEKMQRTPTNIDRLQEEILKLPQIEFPTDHFFCDGMYARAVFRPAGAVLTGRIHKKRHFYIIAYGVMHVTTFNRDGERMSGPERVEGPKVLICEPGSKKAIYAETDGLCITVHRTDETDIEKAENDVAEPDPASPYLPGNKLPKIEDMT